MEDYRYVGVYCRCGKNDETANDATFQVPRTHLAKLVVLLHSPSMVQEIERHVVDGIDVRIACWAEPTGSFGEIPTTTQRQICSKDKEPRPSRLALE